MKMRIELSLIKMKIEFYLLIPLISLVLKMMKKL